VTPDDNNTMLEAKFERLRAILRNTNGIAIAFSGGVDSAFLCAVAQQELGGKALAVTAASPTYPAAEQNEAARLAKSLGIQQIVVNSNELDIPHFADNPPDRCYHCKSELFRIVREVADRHGLMFVADGTNADDEDDYRPGRRAADELSVISPLLESRLTKQDIRTLSRRLDLPTANKPSFACLASRFPYGSRITEQKLKAVDAVESALRSLGFLQVRVRHHGDLARIEVEKDDIARLAAPDVRDKIVHMAKQAGFRFVSVDLEGYRTGSMNEQLGLGTQS
jgi:uncharacterized protein